jgi:MFS family permease
MVGGELADRYGRRIVGAFALTVGTIATVFTYIVTGPSLWVWSLIGATIGGAAVPALGVYQTELFPTAIRGRAKSGIVVITLVGSSIGLLGAAAARDNGVSYGRIMTVLAIGPLLVSLLVLFAYPETARRELEQINPEDAGPSAL